MHIAEASAEHDLLMNSYLQTNKDNHSHSDSLCLAAHKMHVNGKKEKRKKRVEIKTNKQNNTKNKNSTFVLNQVAI